jgi:alkylation response protein AidB-like acyl-CoA dehydrogenase/rhodanese-related sulfurtransferase
MAHTRNDPTQQVIQRNQEDDQVTVEQLVDLIQSAEAQEFAIVDVREKRAQAQALHLIHSVPLPASQLEYDAPRLLPSLAVRVVVVDDQGGSAANAAAQRLRDIGYTNVAVLHGGVQAWQGSGLEVYTGVCAYSKAFGEYVEHQYHTPSISAQTLKAKLDARENVLVVDGRSTNEFLNFSIPSAYSVPNAELPLRVPGLVDNDQTLVVVNCAGRTRSIIGAQALINSGLANPVVALRNGTMDWLKEGFALQSAHLQEASLPEGEALQSARRSVATLNDRYGIEWINQDQLERLRQQREQRSLYIIDVRSKPEFDAGHLPGAQWVPGGELVQWLGRHVGVRNGHIVLVDDEEGLRAAVTASWLLQLNIGHVYALRTESAQRNEHAVPQSPTLVIPEVEQWSPALLEAALQRGEVALLDVSTSTEFVRGHIPGARYTHRSTIDPAALAEHHDVRQWVLTSSDGTLAAWVAHDLRNALPGLPVLAGGNAAWHQAGLALEPGDPALLRTAVDAEPSPYDEDDRQAAFDAYLAWEIELFEIVSRDSTIHFRTYPLTSGAQDTSSVTDAEEDQWSALFRQIAASASAHENEGSLPRTAVRSLLERGFGALILPREIGGGGLSYRELFALVVRLAAADANVAHIFRNHYGFVNGLLTQPDRAKADHWLQRVASGELFAAAVTDAVRPINSDGRIADLGRFSTTLRQDGQTLTLDGSKQYATGSIYADWLTIQATRDDGSETVTAIVRANAPGVEVIDDWAGFGQRFTGSGTVNIKQVHLDSDTQILQQVRSRPGAEYISTLPQLFLTAVIAGIIRASFNEALALLKRRKQHLYFAPTGTPTEDPLLLQTLGQLSANAYAAKSIILHAAEAFDHAASLPLELRSAANHAAAVSAAQAKITIDALGPACATQLFDIGGASATHRAQQLDRLWRNARTISTHNPASYKAMVIGAFFARGEPLPKQGFF